jgi:ABC-type multidrug transport system fused ATPase/permease subunit
MPSLKNLGAKKLSYSGNFAIIDDLYGFCQRQLKTIPDGKTAFERFSDSIRFENVDFDYHGKKTVLKNISFQVEKGKTTALVGKSGSGKTTIVNLILRLFAIREGRIIVDGVSLSDLRSDSWLDKIGYVSQDTFIFNASIKDNIVFGRREDDNRLIEVCRLANAYSFIEELPMKYDTVVGDKGLKLSGGQRQRIAIARAMYADPEILIFDEATSSLDNLSEKMIQESLKKISLRHTVILVAHRLSTIIDADKILVLDNGSIVEEGTHEELVRNGRHYWSLYQTKEFSVEGH